MREGDFQLHLRPILRSAVVITRRQQQASKAGAHAWSKQICNSLNCLCFNCNFRQPQLQLHHVWPQSQISRAELHSNTHSTLARKLRSRFDSLPRLALPYRAPLPPRCTHFLFGGTTEFYDLPSLLSQVPLQKLKFRTCSAPFFLFFFVYFSLIVRCGMLALLMGSI